MDIPVDLVRQIERGNGTIFVGAGLSIGAGLPGWSDLVRPLAQTVGARWPTTEADLTTDHLLAAAQHYQNQHGRNALIRCLLDKLDTGKIQPTSAQHLIASLPVRVIFTTNYDDLLERALKDTGKQPNVIVDKLKLAYWEEEQVQVVKLCGELAQPDSIVLTRRDFNTYFATHPRLAERLRVTLESKTAIFLGYSLQDPFFNQIWDTIGLDFDYHRSLGYAVLFNVSPLEVEDFRQRGIYVINLEVPNELADAAVKRSQTYDQALIAWLEKLSDQVQAETKRQYRPTLEVSKAPLPERPYKLLDYYETKDAAIFFGRRQETQILGSLIHAHRLVLLYGASGTGKTSLLLAGTVPQLEQVEPPYTTIYVRALEDPAQAIRRMMHRQLSDTELSANGSLLDFLDAATKALSCPLVIILDQFEEFFIRLSPQYRTAFIAELGALYDARDVPVKIVLSLREDWLAAVSEIEGRIPEVFRTKMRLLPMNRDQARQAITGPVEKLGVAYEPTLLDVLLDDLMGNDHAEVMPPQLQLVCSALYSQLQTGERLITGAMYNELGGARGVLQQYLDGELTRLGSKEQVLARAMLEELVTSQGTKAVKSADEMALNLDVAVSDVEQVLGKLVTARLLRVLEWEGNRTSYELAHEYLIGEISFETETQKRKQAEELIKQEVENWQRFGTLLAADKLMLINEVRQLLHLNSTARELLLHSALQTGYEINYWVDCITNPARRITTLVAATQSRKNEMRQRAVEVLGAQARQTLGGEQTVLVVNRLRELTLTDPEEIIRRNAAVNLVKWHDITEVVTEISNAQNVPPNRVAEVLAYLLDQVGSLPGVPFHARWRVFQTMYLYRFKQARLVLFIRTMLGAAGAAIPAGLAMALAAYFLWGPDIPEFRNLPLATSIAMGAVMGGIIGGIQGGSAAFSLTCADVLVRKPRAHFRLISGMIGGGLALSVTFVLLRLAQSFALSYRDAMAAGFMIGSFGAAGAVLAVPRIGSRRLLLFQSLYGAVAAAFLAFVIVELLGWLVPYYPPDYLLLAAMGYAALQGLLGGGMALGVGMADRSQYLANIFSKGENK